MTPSRRQFLLGASSAAFLAACGSSGNSGSKSPVPTTIPASATTGGSTGVTDTTVAGGPTVGDAPKAFQVVQRFPSSPLFTAGAIRLPVSISDGQNLSTKGPATLKGSIVDAKGNSVVDVTAKFRFDGIVVPYYEVRATLPGAAIYTLRFDGDDGQGATFETFAPAEVKSPLTGKPLPPFDTPTVDNHRGVEPYCTLTPNPCPLHAMTLTDALKLGKPLCYMVGTPAHCQTGTCAPGLEFLVAEHDRVGDKVVMVHADIYSDNAATQVAPAIEALNVDYEPIIYFCDTTGVIVDRLDGVWDRGELRDRMDALLKA
jgi:hypothetical protein